VLRIAARVKSKYRAIFKAFRALLRRQQLPRQQHLLVPLEQSLIHPDQNVVLQLVALAVDMDATFAQVEQQLAAPVQ
jgi:hypothetical protein